MIPDFKKNIRVTLKRDGKEVSSNRNELENQLTPKTSVGLGAPMVERNFGEAIAQKLLHEPYKSEFIHFSSNCCAKFESTPGRKDCVRYLNAAAEEIGQVYLQNNHVAAACNSEQYGNTYIHRSENFLNTGLLKERLLRIYTKRRYRAELTHFCYEVYNKDGQMEFCATNINDSSISNHEGDFVRYIYENGRLFSKEIYAGKDYRFGSLGRGGFYPPVITSTGGTLNVRYVSENGRLIKETGFHRTINPLLIVGNKNGAETFVHLNGYDVCRNVIDYGMVLDDSMCRVHIQEELFKKFKQKFIEETGRLNIENI